MTETEQRIAIAKASGWEFCSHPQCLKFHDPATGSPKSELPDYLNDRNAIYAAIATQLHGDNEREMFALHLWEIVGCQGKYGFTYGAKMDSRVFLALAEFVCATEKQLCQAFLRTKGLWK